MLQEEVSSNCVSGIAVSTLTTPLPLWESRLGNFGIKDSFLHTWWDIAYCTAVDQLMDKAVVGVTCSVHVSRGLLCWWQSCPLSSSFTEEKFPRSAQTDWVTQVLWNLLCRVQKAVGFVFEVYWISKSWAEESLYHAFGTLHSLKVKYLFTPSQYCVGFTNSVTFVLLGAVHKGIFWSCWFCCMNTKKGWNISQHKPGSAGCIEQHQFPPAESLSQNVITRKKKACGSSTALVIALARAHHSGVTAFPFLAVSHCCADSSGEEIKSKEWVKIVWEWVPWSSTWGWAQEMQWPRSACILPGRSDH